MPSHENRRRESGTWRHHRSESRHHTKRRRPSDEGGGSGGGTRRGTSSHALSADALAQLNAATAAPSHSSDDGEATRRDHERERRERREREQERQERRERRERRGRRERRERHERERQERRERHERERREQSGAEEETRHGRGRGGGDRHEPRTRDRYESTRHDRHDRHARSDRRRQNAESAERRPHGGHARHTRTHYIEHEPEPDASSGGSEEDEGYARVAAGGAEDRRHRRQRDRRIPSGAVLEEGRARGGVREMPPEATARPAAVSRGPLANLRGHLRGGFGGLGSSSSSSNNSSDTRNSIERTKEEQLYYAKQRPPSAPWSKKKKILVFGGAGVAALIVLIAVVAVVVSKKHSKSGGGGSSASSSDGSSSGCSGLDCISPDSIPSDAPSWLNPYTWVDTTDFNLTYTNETVGGLPVMGLNTSYDNSAAANGRTKPLSEAWGSYATTPARGVNLGGWLSLEPFITPSLFNFEASLGIVDEWTLCAHLGTSKCASTLESHYATFVTEATFAEIAAAGLDHVRIPYSYWAVEVYDGDPYLFRTSWRYLLRGIEWARRHGLRVNLDLHGLPGSQNGWNHSGRQGTIGWMNGTDGDLNVQRSLEVHDRLSRFFAQARYANVVSHYGLANEPRMTFLSVEAVMNWTQTAAALVRRNGVANTTVIVFGDGFCGLSRWQGQANTHNLALDVHQYEIFNNAQLVYTHADKVRYACSGWTAQTEASMDTATGFGPTIVAEWSQADTDCATYLGNVDNGNRWTGTYDVGNASLNALTPMCPAQNASCSCTAANAAASTYSSTYKQFLLMFAEAQMYSFEKGWGWWYWTWDTETATQWSYRQGLAAGILPADASQRSFQCDLDAIPDFADLSEFY